MDVNNNLTVKTKSQNVFKIAFGTKVTKVPPLNSQKLNQQQQPTSTSILKTSNVI